MKFLSNKFIAAIFSITFLILFSIFIFYNLWVNKLRIDMLAIEEGNIARTVGPADKEETSFCYYPESGPILQCIAWDEKNIRLGKKSLHIIFVAQNGQGCLGIRRDLTLAVSGFLEKGYLQFWVKGKNNYGLIKDFKICLRNNLAVKNTVVATLPLEIDRCWRRVSIPFKQFVLIKESSHSYEDKSDGFEWNIQEFLFCVSRLYLYKPIELFISDLKIMNNEEIISEIF